MEVLGFGIRNTGMVALQGQGTFAACVSIIWLVSHLCL